MSVVISQKFVVAGESFDTLAEAEAFVASQTDRLRVDAYIDHLKANGAQRVSKAVTEALLGFIKFESGDKPVEEMPDGPLAGTDTTHPEEDAASAAIPDPAPAQATTADKAVGKSQHVAGPDENDDEDPLAGLDV